MSPIPTLAMLLSMVVGLPPLLDHERTRLETARDGRDHREEAFVALLENIRRAERGGDIETGEPDLERWLASPDEHRGAPGRIRGRLEQQTTLESVYGEVAEWFVRDDADRPLLVYVTPLAGEAAAPIRDGARVTLDGRFYKSVDFVARDGVQRRYPAFVAVWPEAGEAAEDGTDAAMVALVVGVVGLLLVFLFIRIATASRRRGGRRLAPVDRPRDEIDVDDGDALPDDPEAALAELRRRAETDD